MSDDIDFEKQLQEEVNKEYDKTSRAPKIHKCPAPEARKESAPPRNAFAQEEKPHYNYATPGPHTKLLGSLMLALDITHAENKEKAPRAEPGSEHVFNLVILASKMVSSGLGSGGAVWSVFAEFCGATRLCGALPATYSLLAALLIVPFQKGPYSSRLCAFLLGNAILITLARATSTAILWLLHSIYVL